VRKFSADMASTKAYSETVYFKIGAKHPNKCAYIFAVSNDKWQAIRNTQNSCVCSILVLYLFYLQYGESALIMASAKGYTEIVRLLLEIGAKFDLRKQVGSREED